MMDERNDEILAERVIGAAIAVHRELGAGFAESTYERALSVELNFQSTPHQSQVPVSLRYRDQTIGDGRLDLLIQDRIIVELKAVDTLHPAHTRQLTSYLKATGLHYGLLINFNHPTLVEGVKRVLN